MAVRPGPRSLPVKTTEDCQDPESQRTLTAAAVAVAAALGARAADAYIDQALQKKAS